MNEIIFEKRNMSESAIPTTYFDEHKPVSGPHNEGIGMILKQIEECTRVCVFELETIDQYMFGRVRNDAANQSEPRCFYEDVLKHATNMKKLSEKLTMLREGICGSL
ncbi:MAG: hypothetical protein J6S14_10990 [Clostridia bacterium]|nr:hypothetical protein [Clostridia bacterium]